MTDVFLRHFADGGDIEVAEGRISMSDGLEEAVYLSLLGGNERDGGGDATLHLEWWGNKGQTVASRRYRSEFQHLLRSLPLAPRNLRRLEDAALRDLAWFADEVLATFVGVTVRIPKLNTAEVEVSLEIDDREYSFAFTESARALAA